MADQHNENIPAAGNVILADVADLKENLEYHKDCFEAICEGWSNTVTTSLKVDVLKDIAWTDISSFDNSWDNVGAPYFNAAYTKDVEGFVYLRGAIDTGSSGDAAFTLPVGYRPTSTIMLLSLNYIPSVAAGHVTIDSNGIVTPYKTYSQVFLDGLCFHAS